MQVQSDLASAQLADAVREYAIRPPKAQGSKPSLAGDEGKQQEPVPDAQHQVAMQQAEEEQLAQAKGRDRSNSEAIDRSPTVRINMQEAAARAPLLVVKTTTTPAVAGMTFVMGACSVLGAVPFFFVGALSKEWAAMANAVACGVMLAASFDLLHEGQPYGAGLVIVGLLSGALFINAVQTWLQQYEGVKFDGLQGASARKALLMFGIMTAHAFGEGSGVGVSFCGNRGWMQGLLVTIAIGLHNIPEGLAVATVLVAKGITAQHAFWWTFATSLPQPLLAVVSFMFVETFSSLLPLALGFAAGCMLWMVFAELLPDALEDCVHGKVATAATFSAAWLEGLRMMLAGLEQPQGGLSLDRGTASGWRAGAILLLGVSAAGTLAGGLIGKAVAPAAWTLGAAAGALTWLGGADLAYQSVLHPHAHLLTTALAAVVGGLAVLFTRRSLMSQAWGGPAESARKEKADVEGQRKLPNGDAGDWSMVDQPSRLAPGSPLILPLTNGDASALDEHHSGKVFPSRSKRKLQAGSSQARTVSSVLAVLALSIQGISEGWGLASLTGSSSSEASRLLPPVMIRAAFKAAAVAMLAGHVIQRPSAAFQAIMAMLVCCISPVCAAIEILQRGEGPGTPEGHWPCTLQAAAAGGLVTVALCHVLPHARIMRSPAAHAGFVVGLGACGCMAIVLQLLCWSTIYCYAVRAEMSSD